MQATNASNQTASGNDGVTIQNGFKIVFGHPGTYIQFSAQVSRMSGANEVDLDIWFRQNGVDFPNSNSAVPV